MTFQFLRNLIRICVGGEAHRLSDRHFYVAWTSENAIRLPQIVESRKAHGNYWNVQLFREQANARAERGDLAVLGGLAFGKNQNVPAAIREIASERKTLQEAGPSAAEEIR